MDRLNIILDSDVSNEADDLFAIIYLLKSNIFNVKAITIAPFKHSKWNGTVAESVDASYKEACKLYDYLGIHYYSNILKGSKDYFKNGYIEETDAIKKMYEIIKECDKTYILAIGCLTNIAVLLNNHPEVINKIEVIWLGSNFLFGDNQDFNFKQDVDAVRYVFSSKIKLTVIPCSPITSNLLMSIYELKYELKSGNELNDYLIDRFYDRPWGPHRRWPLWDISAVAYMINKSWFKTMDVYAPEIGNDNKFIFVRSDHKITFVRDLKANLILDNMFEVLNGDEIK